MFGSSEKPGEPVSFEPASQPDFQARAPRRPSRWRRAGRGFLWLMALLVVAHAGLNVYASLRLNRALERARAQGDPLTLPELAPPAAPAAQNAALLYEQAYKAASYSGQEERLLLKLGQPGARQDAQALAILARSQNAVELVRRASTLPSCQFPMDWNLPPWKILFPQYTKMRRLARLMGVQAGVEARRGDLGSALRDAHVIFAMSAHLKDEPVMIGFLVARAINAVANRTVARIIEATPISAAQARAFENGLPAVDWSASARHSMLGERAFGLSAFEMMLSNSSQLQDQSIGLQESGESVSITRLVTSPLGALWSPVLKLDEVETLRLWAMYIQTLTPTPLPMPPSRMEAIDQAVQKTPPYALLTKILFPVFSRAYQNRERAEVENRQRQVALALAVYRTSHGHYPYQLAQATSLSGAMPQDLYAPQPFRYGSDGRSFHLYSIGPNRVDDGGRDQSGHDLNGQRAVGPTSSVATDDIVWNPVTRSR